MTTIILVLSSIISFFVGLFSPKRAIKLQRKMNKIAKRLHKGSVRFWNPVTWFAQSSIEFIRRLTNGSAEWGKKLRKKLGIKKKSKRT